MANFNDVKNKNKLTLLELIKSNDVITRAQLSRLTGLTRATVSALIGELLDESYIKELGRGDSKKGRGGRKPVLISLNEESMFYLGIDLHWDFFQIAVSNIKGEILYEDIYFFDKRQDPDEYFEEVRKKVFKVFSIEKYSKRIRSIGMSVYGVVDTANNILKFPSHMNWDPIELKKYIEDFPVKVYIESRSAASLLAETWFHDELYPKKGLIVFINVIEGIGGAVMINGEIIKNGGISTGEIGHTVVDLNGNKCSCGKNGCLEAYISDRKLVEAYVNEIDNLKLPTNSIRDMARRIAHMSTLGDRSAMKAMRELTKILSVGIGNVINFLSPSYVIVGGFITDAWSFIEPVLKEEVAKQALPGLFISTKVVPNHYGDKSGLNGSLAVAIKENMQTLAKKDK
ncbi:MAG: ROK family transcriptional regulator [Kosmotoga sp.]|nr:MAG: ROK family transcriptional regulator [Kosmotoga sp.]